MVERGVRSGALPNDRIFQMHIIIGLLLGIALLYFWLVGHWFARILMFIVLTVLFSAVALAGDNREPATNLFLLALAIGAGWIVASLPLYYWRRRIARAPYLRL